MPKPFTGRKRMAITKAVPPPPLKVTEEVKIEESESYIVKLEDGATEGIENHPAILEELSRKMKQLPWIPRMIADAYEMLGYKVLRERSPIIFKLFAFAWTSLFRPVPKMKYIRSIYLKFDDPNAQAFMCPLPIRGFKLPWYPLEMNALVPKGCSYDRTEKFWKYVEYQDYIRSTEIKEAKN
eukprot:TRINITY_DN21711_c0_g1_i1.p1 TRINITY_DN21711_c0_g1~~TRINITY_DN21711_c0_g1_i1.p1  ORF type:complete len:201 (+),score=4.16 TRINITY_DN21711_c0_g1_i1:59-604(+)